MHEEEGADVVLTAFAGAAAAPPGERARVARQLCRGDAESLHQVLDLLAARERDPGFLEVPLADQEPPVVMLPPQKGRLASGEHLGDFVVLDYLGRGGSGEVYRATQRSLGREVALKVLTVEGTTGGGVRRFLQGARAAADIRHPHLVELHDVGRDDERGLLWCAMGLVEGQDLASRLRDLAARDEPLSHDEVRAIVGQVHDVADALAVLHERKLVHRDVKPANVLIEGDGQDGRAVLVDFGLTRDMYEGTQLSTLLATPAYAAPEVSLGRTADARADVFGLGMTLHDLLARRLPEARRGLAFHDLEPLGHLAPAVDAGLEAIVQRATDVLPQYRYADAGALRDDLRAWLDGGRVRARSGARRRRLRTWVMHDPRRVGRLARNAGTLVLVALAGSLGVLLARDVSATLGQLERAARAGAPGELERSARELPGPLRGLLVRDETARFLRELDDPDTPLARVRARAEEASVEEGRLLAARYVERDGLVAHPLLTRLLADAVERPPDRRDEALALLARLLIERPLESPEEHLAGERWRRAIERSLGEAGGDPLHALAALSGCGDARSFRRILRWLEERSGLDFEELRIASASLASIAKRSLSCRFLDGELLTELERGLDVTRAWARELSSSTVDEEILFPLYMASAVASRRLGASLPAESFAPFDQNKVLLAALGDPRGRIAATKRLKPPPDGWSATIRERANCARLIDDPQLLAESEAALLTSCRELGGDVTECRAAFERGVQTGYHHLMGLQDPEAIDGDTHLGAALVEAPHTWELSGIDFQLRDNTLLDVAVDRDSTVLRGDASIRFTGVLALNDDGTPFLRLGNGGRSSIELRFRPDAMQSGPLNLHLRFQKGARFLFPNSGEAWLEVRMDGELCAVINASDPASCVASIVLPTPAGAKDRPHVLTLRVTDDSTTTVRLYGLRLHY